MGDGNNISLGNRMKSYENSYRLYLPMRLPVIIRLDGKAFHSLTRNCNKPFDINFIKSMQQTGIKLCEEIQGAQVAYIQSDEINILLHNYKKLNSCAWFDNNIQKMASVSSAIASVEFSKLYGKSAYFDSRCFILPENEVNNLYVWRQRDWKRNSVQMLARSIFSHKECENKNNNELQEMVFNKANINWSKLDGLYKNGCCVIKNDNGWTIDNDIPIFSEVPDYINKLLKTEET